jgi:hypothetical protein
MHAFSSMNERTLLNFATLDWSMSSAPPMLCFTLSKMP